MIGIIVKGFLKDLKTITIIFWSSISMQNIEKKKHEA